MNSMQMEIKQGELEKCYELALKIPEFSDGQYTFQDYLNRLNHRTHLVLTIYHDGQLAGFKIGYEKEESGVFYSWLGGILPEFRKLGLATALAKEQERIIQESGFHTLEFKTRNYLKPMLIFGLTNGFYITGLEKRAKPIENRIILRKSLGFRTQNNEDSRMNP